MVSSASLRLQKNSIIYILDIGARTGGGEALYQLRLDLEHMGYEAYILYYQEDLSTLNLSEKFLQYFDGAQKICTRKDVIDDKNNCIIVPEAATTYLFDYPNLQKIIWWLSIHNYDGAYVKREPRHSSLLNPLKKVYHRIQFWKLAAARMQKYHKVCFPLNQVVLHMAGSYYVLETLKTKYHIQSELLIHSIGIDFLKMGEWSRQQDIASREDIVLYNPSKPSSIMHQLLQRNKFHYIPICNMTPTQMIALFRKSKLYIDFGFFPGPERLPKETVYNGVAVLVGKRNASVNPYDVMIPEEYKLDPHTKPELVEMKIADMLERYDEIYHDFDAFRQMITEMGPNYYLQLKKFFQGDLE